jgi:hypothetical protein
LPLLIYSATLISDISPARKVEKAKIFNIKYERAKFAAIALEGWANLLYHRL